jgi:hypothetical protein
LTASASRSNASTFAASAAIPTVSPAVAAAELEDVLFAKVRQAVKRSEMSAFRIEVALQHVADY